MNQSVNSTTSTALNSADLHVIGNDRLLIKSQNNYMIKIENKSDLHAYDSTRNKLEKSLKMRH